MVQSVKKRALWNRCPVEDCGETVLWMPHENRCGKCGYGGTPKNSYGPTYYDEADPPLEMFSPLGVLILALIFVLGFAAGKGI